MILHRENLKMAAYVLVCFGLLSRILTTSEAKYTLAEYPGNSCKPCETDQDCLQYKSDIGILSFCDAKGGMRCCRTVKDRQGPSGNCPSYSIRLRPGQTCNTCSEMLPCPNQEPCCIHSKVEGDKSYSCCYSIGPIQGNCPSYSIPLATNDICNLCSDSLPCPNQESCCTHSYVAYGKRTRCCYSSKGPIQAPPTTAAPTTVAPGNCPSYSIQLRPDQSCYVCSEMQPCPNQVPCCTHKRVEGDRSYSCCYAIGPIQGNCPIYSIPLATKDICNLCSESLPCPNQESCCAHSYVAYGDRTRCCYSSKGPIQG